MVASPAARWLDAEPDRAGRVKVRVDLSVPGHPNIFVVGDTAAVTDQPGIPRLELTDFLGWLFWSVVHIYFPRLRRQSDVREFRMIAMVAVSKRGRPSDYSFQVAISICARLAEGKSLRAICSEAGMPGRATVFRWIARHKEFATSTHSPASFGRKICRRND